MLLESQGLASPTQDRTVDPAQRGPKWGGGLFRVQGAGRRVGVGGGHMQPGTALGSLSAEPEATLFVCKRTASFAFFNSFLSC